MPQKHRHLSLLADLFDYPTPTYPDRVNHTIEFLKHHNAEAAEELIRFENLLPFHDSEEPLIEMEELYTRTFDVQAITTLDVGYVLFGDDYKRGELLVHMNREHRLAGNECGSELSDHLPNVLRLISKLDDLELAEELVLEILAPALRRMIAEFDPARVAEKRKTYKKHYKTLIDSSSCKHTLYAHALKALNVVLTEDFSLPTETADSDQNSSFICSVKREFQTEHKSIEPRTPKGVLSWPC